MGATANFNLNHPVGPNYDNYIMGAAYNHDFYSVYSFAVGGEVGLADRFGSSLPTRRAKRSTSTCG